MERCNPVLREEKRKIRNNLFKLRVRGINCGLASRIR